MCYGNIDPYIVDNVMDESTSICRFEPECVRADLENPNEIEGEAMQQVQNHWKDIMLANEVYLIDGDVEVTFM